MDGATYTRKTPVLVSGADLFEREMAKVNAMFAERGWSFANRPLDSWDGLASSIAAANQHRLRNED